MSPTEPRSSPSQRIAIAISLAALLCGLACGGYLFYSHIRGAEIKLPVDQYFAVYLTGGQLYFGKLQGLGTPFPVLTNVFYVQSRQDNQTKQVTNILVKRGKEWHGPDRMYLNAAQIILAEPVGPTSRVAELINEANR
jgi:hypothetical protein